MADSLARASLNGPIISVLPVVAQITAIRYRKFSIRRDIIETITSWTEFQHLKFPWKVHWCPSRQSEVIITKLRCRVPPLNLYLHRAGLAISPLCQFCLEIETVEHYFLICRRYKLQRKRLIEIPLAKLGVNLTLETVLTFGASVFGFSHRDVFDAVCSFIQSTKRINF